jgi:SPP1 family predicted phage head-tail adaptor
MALDTANRGYNFSTMQYSGILQQNTPLSDGSGGQIDNWTDLLTTRVSLEKRSGRLSNGEGKMEYQRDYRLVCRYQTAIVIDADTRWLINGVPYKIEDYEQIDQKPFQYVMFVSKNDG